MRNNIKRKNKMVLKLLHTTGTPLGEFDGLDAELTTYFGGEVATFGTALLTADMGAADVSDGYLNPGTSRVVLVKTAGTTLPFMLVDDGGAGYGTSFGTITGGTAGQQPTGGVALGPHSAAGSGKLTVWATPGLFAVSTNDGACDTTVATGLVPTNASLVPGAKLFVMTGGKLTPNSSASGASASAWAGRFVSFETDRSLVKTPGKLVQALNSPTGATGALAAGTTWAVFYFSPNV
jgi:hypothetical protein